MTPYSERAMTLPDVAIRCIDKKHDEYECWPLSAKGKAVLRDWFSSIGNGGNVYSEVIPIHFWKFIKSAPPFKYLTVQIIEDEIQLAVLKRLYQDAINL